jgi:Predicted site-specific integrase-resolvase
MMFKEQDEKALWDTVAILRHESRMDSVTAFFKMAVERTLALLRKPTDFLEVVPFVMPPVDILQSFQELDTEIRRTIRFGEHQKTYFLLVEYIDRLTSFVPNDELDEMRKLIWANMLAASEPATIHVQEKVEVYTSSDVAEILSVSDQTIRRWCEKGKYPEAFQTEGGHWRIPQKYFKITLEQARKRKAFEQQLNDFNATKGEANESEWLK